MASRDKKLKKAWSGRAGKVRTLSDLNRHSLNSDSDSDSDDDPHQNSYSGGGQKSRKLDKEPSKSNDVDAIFNEAKQVGDLERLLSAETAHQHQPPPAAAAHNIVFWSNGFTVDDGPLRNLDDPQNVPFLESITKSECPKELEPADGRSSVNVNLIRRNDKYTEPEKPHVLVPFQGVGRTLGVRGNSSTPTSTSGVVEAIATSPAGDPTPTPFAGVEMVVDESLPSTSIQLRLADGTRLISRFNYNHRVSDIRAFIDASRPEGGGGRNYELQMVGFPPTILTDETQTIEQAGLANSVVIQKF